MTTWAMPGADFPATSEDAPTGLTGTIGVRIYSPDADADVVARTTSGIIERPAGSGLYFATLTAPVTPGTYAVIWDTGGATPFYAADDLFVSSVNPATLPSGLELCTVDDVKTIAVIEDDDQDDNIAARIADVSKVLPTRYQREFAPVNDGAEVTRRVTVRGRRVDLNPYDLLSVTTMTLDPDGDAVALAATQYRLRPVPSLGGTFYVVQLGASVSLGLAAATEFGELELEIFGVWGMAVVPDDVRRAAALTAASWLDRAVTGYGIDPDGLPGTITPDFAGTWAIPAAAHRIMQPYARIGA